MTIQDQIQNRQRIIDEFNRRRNRELVAMIPSRRDCFWRPNAPVSPEETPGYDTNGIPESRAKATKASVVRSAIEIAAIREPFRCPSARQASKPLSCVL